MAKKPTYEELEKRIQELEKESINRKQAEQALQESEGKYSKTFHFAPVIIAISNLKDGKYIEVNETFLRLLGYRREEVVGHTSTELKILSRESREKLQLLLSKNKAFYNVELEMHTKNRSWRTVKFSAQVIELKGEECIVSIAENITRQKHAEYVINIQHELGIALSKTSEIDEALALVVDAAISFEGLDNCGIYLKDSVGERLDLLFVKGLSPEFTEAIRHYDKETPNFRMIMQGAPVYSSYVKTGLPLDDVRRSGGIKVIGIIPMIHMGKVIGCLNVGSHTVDEIPEASQNALETMASQISSGIARVMTEEEKQKQNRELQALNEELKKEIDERKQTNTALRKSEEKFRSLVESSTDWIWEVNAQGVYSYASPQVEAILGYKPEEVVGKTPFDLMQPEEARQIREIFKDIIGKGESMDAIENINLHKDGRHVVLETSGVPVLDEAGKVTGYRGVDRDITERKQAEEALKKSEALLNATQQMAKIGGWEWDFENKLISWTDETYRIHGFDRDKNRSPEEGIQLSLECYDPEDRPIVLDTFRRCIEKGEAYDLEFPFTNVNGDRIWIRTTAKAIIENDRVVKAFGNIIDITERNQAKEALKESEERWRSLVNNSKDIIQILNVEGTILYMNKVYPPHELNDAIGKSVLEFMDHKSREMTRMSIKNLLETKEPQTFEISILLPENVSVPVEVKYVPTLVNGKVDNIISLVTNIEERKRVKEALQESEKQYRTVVETSPDVIFSLSTDGELTSLNHAFHEITGWSIAEWIGKPFLSILIPDDQPIALNNFQKALQGQTISPFELHILSKSGEVLVGEFNIVPEITNGKVNSIIGFGRDITDRISAEKALWESREKYRLLAENVTDIIWTMDMDMKFTYFSPSVTRMRGYSVEEAMAQPIEESMTPDSFESAMKNIAEKLELYDQGQIDPNKSRKMEAELICKDGSTVWTEIESSFLFYPEGQPIGILGVTRDITERKQAEEDKNRLQAQLQQAQKMEAIGTLAGGIAHDFNNILMGIFGYTQLLQMKLQKDRDMLVYLDSILKAGKRAKDLVQQILTFSRQTDHQLNPLRAQDIIEEALKLIKSSLPSTISISQEIQKDCGLVLADHTQLHQIVMNLCTNGYQAMEEAGGKLTVTLKEVDLAAEDLKNSAMNPGAYVCLSVADTGTGIDQSVIDRIFDPYFTTKEKGKGTGLGLAVIHGIVKSHGGHITVDSESGKGTEVLVYLPVMKDETEAAESMFDMTIRKGNEHILLVDDEKDVIDIEQQMLEMLGYNVTTRTGSLDALEAFRANSDNFDMVITDMTMPEMTGDKLAGELLKIRPDIPIILCTGFSERMSKEKAKEMGMEGYIMKPIVMGELGTAIREILDKGQVK